MTQLPYAKTRWQIVSEYLHRMRAIEGVMNGCHRTHCTPAAIHGVICKIYPRQTKKATTELLLKHRKAGDLINPQWGVYKLSVEASEAARATILCPATQIAPLAMPAARNVASEAPPLPTKQEVDEPTQKSFTIQLHGRARITYTGKLSVEFS